MLARDADGVVYQAILPVLVKREDCFVEPVLTYAFYDAGSSGSFMSEELFESLGGVGVPTALQLKTMHGQSV